MTAFSAKHPTSSNHLAVALGIAGLGWLAMAIQEQFLYLRPTPYGEPYVGGWRAYLAYALVYNLLAVMVASGPAIGFWLICHSRPIRPAMARAIHWLQLSLVLVTVALDHLDNEVMRFMGIHLTISLALTYYKVQAWGSDMFDIIAGDRGGPGLPFLILFAVPSLLWWAGRRMIHGKTIALPMSRLASLGIVAVPTLIPLLIVHYKFPGNARRHRVQPEIRTLYVELKEDLVTGKRPEDFNALARAYQRTWFQRSGDTAWRFIDPDRPLLRVPLTPATPVEGPPWNVIFVQLETFRGWNTGFLRPDVIASATPFLDRLARDSASAFWRRHVSFGPPTTTGFMAAHCSVKPHSTMYTVMSFTYTALHCLPTVLRANGYRTELFTGFDPDWDNQTVWMNRWYDNVHYDATIKGQDRAVFRRAAERIRELGRRPQPFMATLVSSANHIPFSVRKMGPGEERFNIDSTSPLPVAIRNTMRYTDDVVRELFETLAREPWFERTLVIITGDHGYDLGERGTSGQDSGWREAVWVPLLIHGPHPGLPRGGHDEPATLMDIAPTVADLLGIREPTSWMGSSLVTASHTGSPFASARGSVIFGERDRFSMVMHPSTGAAGLYDAAEDPLQRTNIAAAHSAVVTTLLQQAEGERRLMDYLLEANRVWRDFQGESPGDLPPPERFRQVKSTIKE